MKTVKNWTPQKCPAVFFYFAGSLDAHLSRHSVEYIQFAFRWMNNLLMREFPLRCVIRLWDSYLVSPLKKLNVGS